MKTNVLLIEDDPWVLQVNRAMLEQETGFCVVGQAQTVRAALEAVNTLEPDLILVDVYLPDGNGLEVVQHVRATRQNCEVIMITAATDASTIQVALRDGAIDYLIKPFGQARLHEALNRYSARRDAIRLKDHLTQRKLDRLLGFPNRERLPKGIDEITLEQIQTCLQSQPEAISADQVGGHVGVSRVTAWRYLEYLQTMGLAILELDYGSVGRPIKRYRATRSRGN